MIYQCLVLVCILTFEEILPINACTRKAPITEVSDAFTSLDLATVANFERALVKIFVDYLGRIPDEMELIKGYLMDYQESNVLDISNFRPNMDESTRVVSHPIMAFRMIRRIVVDLPKIFILVEKLAQNDVITQMYSIKGLLKLPTLIDLNDVILRILRIQTVYDLNVRELAAGKGEIEGVNLSSAHCIEIARVAVSYEKFASAVEWVNAAFVKFYGGDKTTTTDEVSTDMTIIINEHDRILEHNMLRRSGNLENLWERDIFQAPVNTLWKFVNNRLRHLPQHQDDNLFRALQLCSGLNYQIEKVRSTLHCWYEKRRHSYSHICPMRIELLSKDPYLVQIHDFLGSQALHNIFDQTVGTLHFTVSDTSTTPITTNVHGHRKRRQLPLVLMDEAKVTDDFKDLSYKLECFTGHSSSQCTTERLQVVGYAFGNSDLQLEAPDGGIDLNKYTVGVVTSMMIFLNDVEKGGYTVFPKIGIHVTPLEGSALFWVNKMGGKERDTRLMYSECPVILGKKWVARKKIYSRRNF